MSKFISSPQLHRFVTSLSPATRRSYHAVQLKDHCPCIQQCDSNPKLQRLALRNQVRNFAIRDDDDEGIFQRLRRNLGFAKTETKGYILRGAGPFLFVKIADEVKYTQFFEVCNMEDTFASWFTVMELHIWILSCRLMEEGEDGRVTRNAMLKAMWRDIDFRSKKLEGALASVRKMQVAELGNQMNTQLIAYDEGLLSSDRVLAGALWRRFLHPRPPTNQVELLNQVRAVELLVAYTRSHLARLHSLSKADILDLKFKWEDLNLKLLHLHPHH